MNVFEMVVNYFKDETHGVSGYEPIGFRRQNETDDYLYVVIARYVGECNYKKGTYAVWMSFNTSMDGGNMNYGHYELSFKNALTIFNGEEVRPISWDRMSELATKFKDRLEYNDEEALEYFTEECEMTDEELKYFGIEKPKKYKKVRMEYSGSFDVLIPEDVDEGSYAKMFSLADVVDNVETTMYTDVRAIDIEEESAHMMADRDDVYMDADGNYNFV